LQPRLHAALLAGTVALVSATMPAHAQPAPAQTSGAQTSGAQTSGAQKSGSDNSSIWTIQDENSTVTSALFGDHYYTNGLRISWTSPEDEDVPSWVQGLGRALYGAGTQRVSINIGQNMYTAADDTVTKLNPGDWPNSAQLLVTGSLIQDTPGTRSTFAVSLGVTGPWAQGEQLQNGFHDLIGQGHNNGWADQLHNEPAFELLNERIYRYETGTVFGFETDILPELTVGLGNIRVYAQTGATVRFGEGLLSDYGVSRVRPGLSGGDAYNTVQPLAWYVFLGGDGQAVAHDMAIDGNTFQPSPSAKRVPFVGEFQFGWAVIWHGVRLSYTQVFQSSEIRHQKGGLHQFGSLALGVKF
jgi:hypothetical protein